MTTILDDPQVAANIILQGGIVAFPTETVFGLGADATNAAAIEKLFLAKGRPGDNPLIVHVASRQQVPQAASSMSADASLLLDSFSPGPITVVVPKNDHIVPAVTGGLRTVGIRIPEHALARRMIEIADRPIAAPSANLSGKPSATTVAAVLEDFDGRIDAVLAGFVPRIGLESTVVDCTVKPARMLRPGAISLEQLQNVLPDIVQTRAVGRSDNSPGMRYPHYRPKAQVILVDSAQSVPTGKGIAYLGLDAPSQPCELGMYRRFSDELEYAQQFYESLRVADRMGMATIYCQSVCETGIGSALGDRLRRAAT